LTLKKAVKVIKENIHAIPIIVRARDMRYSDVMKEVGATVIVPETYETGLQLGGTILKAIGVSEFEISRLKNRFRAEEYSRAKNGDMPEPVSTEKA
jgi:CPA2 family monovalent cation:H+ antiporter-2